jgi:uncharacterized phage-associated protein
MTNTDPISPETIALRILKLSGEGLTYIRLQRLVYLFHAWSLARLGAPVFSETYSAWSHGPSLDSLWKKYESFGRIYDLIPPEKEETGLPEEIDDLVLQIWEHYRHLDDEELERMTKDEPWARVRAAMGESDASDAPIDNEDIMQHYRDLSG